MAPLSRIHATATEVSRPPEKAMPTRSPTGRDWRTFDMASSLVKGTDAAPRCVGRHTSHASNSGAPPTGLARLTARYESGRDFWNVTGPFVEVPVDRGVTCSPKRAHVS